MCATPPSQCNFSIQMVERSKRTPRGNRRKLRSKSTVCVSNKRNNGIAVQKKSRRRGGEDQAQSFKKLCALLSLQVPLEVFELKYTKSVFKKGKNKIISFLKRKKNLNKKKTRIKKRFFGSQKLGKKNIVSRAALVRVTKVGASWPK